MVQGYPFDFVQRSSQKESYALDRPLASDSDAADNRTVGGAQRFDAGNQDRGDFAHCQNLRQTAGNLKNYFIGGKAGHQGLGIKIRHAPNFHL